jgi:acetoin utilization protein AcuB
MTTIHVRDWMTTDPITISRSASLAAARTMMHKDEIRRLLVVDAESSLVGIVTWGDVVEVWPSRFEPLAPYEVRELMERVLVDEVMVRAPITIDPDATIAEAANVMFEHRIGALPVVEGQRILGILTDSDILQGLVRILSARD